MVSFRGRRSQVEDLLDEAPHGGVVHLGVGHQELVVQQLGVARSLVGILVDTLRDEVIELLREFLLRQSGRGVLDNLGTISIISMHNVLKGDINSK